jgi:hypothetical protein
MRTVLTTPAHLLSPLTLEVVRDAPEAYQALVVTGDPPEPVRELLAGVTPDRILAGAVRDAQPAEALLAGLWLWRDCLDESHAISQGIASPTGSFWHAIMHRREGDFSNAKYWYARCRSHPALVETGRRVAQLSPDLPGRGDAGLERLLAGGGWEPDAFVDLVARAHRAAGSPLAEAAVRIQRAEWAALFDHCAAGAAGV